MSKIKNPKAVTQPPWRYRLLPKGYFQVSEFTDTEVR